MNSVIFFAVLLCGAAAQNFRWEPCSKCACADVIKIIGVDVSPMPVVVPGPLTLSFSVEVLRQIDVALLEFNYTRVTSLGLNVHIPCAANVGSCTVDGCSLVDSLVHGQRQGQRDLGNQITKMFASVGVPSTCPIQKQTITITNYALQLPELSSALINLIQGNYIVEVTAKEPATQRELGCLRLWASLEAKSTGFLFGN